MSKLQDTKSTIKISISQFRFFSSELWFVSCDFDIEEQSCKVKAWLWDVKHLYGQEKQQYTSYFASIISKWLISQLFIIITEMQVIFRNNKSIQQAQQCFHRYLKNGFNMNCNMNNCHRKFKLNCRRKS